MVDTYGRSRPRQANIINARSRLHSPLFRHGRSTTSSRADDDGNDDGSADDPLVRETPLYRHKQSFFGQDFDATVASSAPVRASPMAVASDSGRPPHRGGAARSSTGSTVALDEETHGECHSESALDAGWDTPLLTAENIGRAFSSVSRTGSASQLRAVSSEVSDSLSRMKMRKQEIEMASLVHKVQSQLRTMEDVIKELQNEHTIKNEMIKKQMNETNRILAERDQLQMELRSASQKSAAPASNDMTHLRSSLQSFMQQTEQTQFLMMEQLKSIESSKGSPQRRHSVDAQKIETSVKAAMSEFAALQQNMMHALAPPTPPTAPVATAEKPAEKPVEKPRSLPPVKAASSAWKTAFFAMIGIWLVTLGVGAAQHVYGLDLYSFVAQKTREMHVLVETIQEIETAPEATASTFTSVDDVTDVVTVQVDTDGAVDAPAFVNGTATAHSVQEDESIVTDTAATSVVDDEIGDVAEDSESGNEVESKSTQVDAPLVDVKEDVVVVEEVTVEEIKQDIVEDIKEVIIEEDKEVIIEEIKQDIVEEDKEVVDEVKEVVDKDKEANDEDKEVIVDEVKVEGVKAENDVVDVPTTVDEAIELGAKEDTAESKTVEADEVVSSDAADALDVVNATATDDHESNDTEVVQVVDAAPVSEAVVEVVTDVSSVIVQIAPVDAPASNASAVIDEAVDVSKGNETTTVDAADDTDVADEPTPVVPVVDVEDNPAPVDIKSNVDDDSAPKAGDASLPAKDDQATDEASEAPEASTKEPEAKEASTEEPEAKEETSEASTEEQEAKEEAPEDTKEELEATKDETSEAKLVAANDAPEIAASQDAALVAIVTQFSAYTNVTAHALNASAATTPVDVDEPVVGTDDEPVIDIDTELVIPNTEDVEEAATNAGADVVDEPVVGTDDEPVIDTDMELVVPNTEDVEEATEVPVSDNTPVKTELEATADVAPVDTDAVLDPTTISEDTTVIVAFSEDAPTPSKDASSEVVASEPTSASDKPNVLSAAAKALESLLADK